MLTPELVRANRRGGKLVLSSFTAALRERALILGAELLATARQHVGRTREELEGAWLEVPHEPKERLLLEGLTKLVEDAAEFSADPDVAAADMRRTLFLRASSERSRSDAEFDRSAVLDVAAAELALTADAIERGLYADLRGAHLLTSVAALGPEELVERYALGQVQAVLLRAVKVRVRVACRNPRGYRQLFHKLKFRRLLFSLRRVDGAYAIDIDGPFSLFESVTKYGLQLALLIPALLECDEVELSADVRWGKSREALAFEWQHRRELPAVAAELERSEDVSALLDAFAQRPLWSARPADVILDVPGIGLCVPDLEFTHEPSKTKVYLEILGFWSRDAVFQRAELAQKGLRERILFAASSRLRVSEAVLDDCEQASLYVYKGVMSPRTVERHLDRLLDET